MSASIIRVSARAASRLRAGHPWVYRSDLPENAQETPRAALVHVADERGRFLGSALSSSSSQIALRVISASQISEGALVPLVRERVRAALDYRRKFVQGTNACRLIFSEADSLPGLIVDRYNDVLTLQVLTQAMDRDDVRAACIDELQAGFDEELNIVERAEGRIRELEELPAIESRLLSGQRAATEFEMNGLRFRFDALSGQKTGAFLDQRENYSAAEGYAHGDALDVFTYHGGFALHLARKCSSVTGIDASRAALEEAEANAALNSTQLTCEEIEWLEADAFELLKDYASTGKQYDTIVLDPPAFAKTKRAVEKALSGYKELNLRVLKMLRPGGILATNSCSHHVSQQEFRETVQSAAADAQRKVRILEQRTQAQDHPVLINVPETEYLKCLICYVE